MTVLVTGASGFLGRHLVEKLLLRGHSVRTLARSSGAGLPPGAEHIQGDIKDAAALDAAMAGVETVYHAAAIVPGAGSDAQMWDINVAGTRNVAEACLCAGVRRLVLVSSIAAYNVPLPDLVPESAPVGGASAYGRSKASAEAVAMEVCRGRMESVIARPCQIYGAMDRTGFTKKLLRLIQLPLIPVAGLQSRSFSLIHVSDVTDGLCSAGERAGVDGAILNLAVPNQTSLLELASIYARLLGKKARGAKLPIPATMIRAALSLQWAARHPAQARLGSLFHAYRPRSTHGSILLGGPIYNIGKAMTLLDFSPKVSFEQGLAELIGEAAVRPDTMRRDTRDRVAVTRP